MAFAPRRPKIVNVTTNTAPKSSATREPRGKPTSSEQAHGELVKRRMVQRPVGSPSKRRLVSVRTTTVTKAIAPTRSKPPQIAQRTQQTNNTFVSKPKATQLGKPTVSVAPDALAISSQLAPWIFMSSSLESALQSFESEAGKIIEKETRSLNSQEIDVQRTRTRLDVIVQNALLNDLCSSDHLEFSAAMSKVTANMIAFLNGKASEATILAKLQEQVHNDVWDPNIYKQTEAELEEEIHHGNTTISSLDDLAGLSAPESFGGWGELLEQYRRFSQERLSNLMRLKAMIPTVRSYQQKHIELRSLQF